MTQSEERLRNFLATYLPWVDTTTPEGVTFVREGLAVLDIRDEAKVQAFFEGRLLLHTYPGGMPTVVLPPELQVSIKRTRHG